MAETEAGRGLIGSVGGRRSRPCREDGRGRGRFVIVGTPLRTKELGHLSQKPQPKNPHKGARGPAGIRAGGPVTAKGCLGIRGFCDN